MRTKAPAVKFRPSNSRPPLNPSLISLPFLYQDEPNEEYHVDGGNVPSQDNDYNNDVDGEDAGGGDAIADDNVVVTDDDGVDGIGDYDNVVVPDSVEEVNRHAGGSHGADPSGDCIVVDWLEGEFCIRCYSGGGQVLVCHGNGCPVAIHEACMNFEPNFDDMGIFYCPYCWYKRQLATTKELRRETMLAKKELSNCLCLRRDGGNEEKQKDDTENMKAASVSTMAGKINFGDCENGMNDDDNETIHHNQDDIPCVESLSKEKSDEQSISRAHGFDNVGGGERVQEEDIENASDSEGDEIDEDRLQIPSSSSLLGIVEGTLHASTKETSAVLGVLEKNQGKRGKEELVLPNAVGTTSKLHATEGFEFVSTNSDTETLAVLQKHVKRISQRQRPQKVDSPKNPSFQPSTSVKEMETNQYIKTTIAKNSVQCQESTKLQESVLPNAVGTTSKLHATEGFEFVSTDLDTETLAVPQKHVKRISQRARPQKVDSPKNPSFLPSTSVKDKETNQHVKATIAKNSVQCQESTKRMMIPVLGSEKRRRLHWTTEEEDMLRV
ncbi:hypothetical protein REPUB_Repub13aG0265700 [Reevesia pubescens]